MERQIPILYHRFVRTKLFKVCDGNEEERSSQFPCIATLSRIIRSFEGKCCLRVVSKVLFYIADIYYLRIGHEVNVFVVNI